MIAPHLKGNLNKSAVLCVCIKSNNSSGLSPKILFFQFFSASISATCPAITPYAPAYSKYSSIIFTSFSAPMCFEYFNIICGAKLINASPANTAFASPNTLWFVGFPRL